MKQNIVIGFLLMVFVVSSLVGCKLDKEKRVIVPSDDDLRVTKNSQQEVKKFDKDLLHNVKTYIKEHNDKLPEALSVENEKKLVIENMGNDRSTMYFLTSTLKNTQFSTLFRIRISNGVIDGFDYIATGLQEYFQYKIITISQGKFVMVYAATNVGTGNLLFIDFEKLDGRTAENNPDYQFPALDVHHEKIAFSGSDYEISKIFRDGILIPEFKDVDGDGNTDVLLKGIQETYHSKKGMEEEKRISSRNVSQLYLFHNKINEFELVSSEDLTEKEVLNWNDLMVNNHTLLNDTPFAIITLQDILDYHKNKPCVKIKKGQEELYWHYYTYPGITYVIYGSKKIKETDCLDHIILENQSYSLINGIQVGMREEKLTETAIDFSQYSKQQTGVGKSLDNVFVSDENGFNSITDEKYDKIYYAYSEIPSFIQSNEERMDYMQIRLYVVVKEEKVISIVAEKVDCLI